MSLANKIIVNTNYTRSINLERDADSVSVVESYIPTVRALETLIKVGATLTDKRDMPRAWTLMGPYGSGKSSFAVFLSHLLGFSDDDATLAAQDKLASVSSKASKFFKEDGEALEYCRILLTGSPEPLGQRLIKALHKGADDYFRGKTGTPQESLFPKLPAVVDELEQLKQKKQVEHSEIISAIDSLQKEIGQQGGNGLLIIIDELGKFLEYEARRTESGDIFLLQSIAEQAYKGRDDENSAVLSLFVLLHQSFDQYARGLSKAQQNEWAKVQGRFEVVPFLESTEQTLRVVSKAIELPKKLNQEVNDKVKQVVDLLSDAKALPRSLTKADAVSLFRSCYPLHPVSAMLLPLLCQKIAQNERTLFNYLGSHEENAFQDCLKRLEAIGDWIYPSDIYDYFISNQTIAVVDHMTHRRWAEVVTALERLDTESTGAISLLKTIGLLNIVGAQSGLKASNEILGTCLSDTNKVNASLADLQQQSVVQYRKFNNEYRVWQGSDFDLEEQLQSERGKFTVFSVAEYLKAQYQAKPVVARKFTIQKGALYYFDVDFVDRASAAKLAYSDRPRIIFYLVDDASDEQYFDSEIMPSGSPTDLFVKYTDTAQLRSVVSEVLALRAVENNAQELHSDPVAKREFRDYYQAALKRELDYVSVLFEQPQKSDWFWQKKSLEINSKRDFQSSLSNVLGALYQYMPVIKNELINRDKPSSQAAAGRNKLLELMLANPTLADLGIDSDKFPPEKAIYRAVLRETGLHRQNENGEWGFYPPESGTTLFSAWKVIEGFLESASDKARPFSELESELTSIPVGMKKGVLPILYLAAYLVYEDELAIYEEGNYLPYLPKEVLERFVKTPALFKVQLFRIEGVRASLLKQYVSALFNDERERTVIQAIKPLTTFIAGLNEFSQKTNQGIKDTTRKFRSAFYLAKSPEQLLFEGIPKSLGFDPKEFDEVNRADYSKQLQDAICELRDAYAKLLDEQKRLLAQAVQLSANATTPEIRKAVSRYRGLEKYTVDVDGLRAFIGRLTDESKSDENWLNDILMFLGRKTPEKWTDEDRTKVDNRLSDLKSRLLDLESIRLQHDRNRAVDDGDFDVVLLKTLKQGAQERREPVVINSAQRELADVLKTKLNEILSDEDVDLQLAALAELADEALEKYHNSSKYDKKSTQIIKKVKNG